MPVIPETAHEMCSFITFTVGEEEYAVSSEHVVTVIPGVFDTEREKIARSLYHDVLYGETDALVINMHEYLKSACESLDPGSRFIVFDHEGKKIAILVDYMNDLLCCDAVEYERRWTGKVSTRGLATVREVEIRGRRLQLLDLDDVASQLLMRHLDHNVEHTEGETRHI